MKEEQREFIEIMESFRKLNIACMLPAEISHGEFSLLKMIQHRIEGEKGATAKAAENPAGSGISKGETAGRSADTAAADTAEKSPADSGAEKRTVRPADTADTAANSGKGVKVSWLVKKACVPAPAISRTLRSLEQKGFIERTVDREDRRNTFVSLTDAGTAINKEIDRIMEGFADAVFGNMGEETMQKMNGYLRQFLETSRAEIEKRRYTGRKTEK